MQHAKKNHIVTELSRNYIEFKMEYHIKKKVQLVKCMLTHRDMEKKYTKTHNSASLHTALDGYI